MRRSTSVLTLSAAAATALAVASAAPAFAADATVVNGGFESTPETGGFATVLAGGTLITGWTVTGDSVDLVTSDYWQPNSGRQSVDLDGNGQGGLSQQLTLQAGQSYTVNFALAGNPDGGPTTKDVTVSLAGSSHSFSFSTATTSRTAMGWTPESFNVTAPATGPATLAFDSATAGDFGPVIDDVSVTPQATPSLPETPYVPLTALVGIGVIGTLVAVRRRVS